jgi:hypothetical protein
MSQADDRDMRGPVRFNAHDASHVQWIREWKQDGLTDFRIGRTENDLVAEWVGMGVLRASRSGDRKEFTASPGVDSVQVEKFHQGLVNAMVRHLQGKMTLHASAVALSDVAVALAGESRSGKSTTSASLCRNPEVRLLADDTVALEDGPTGFVVTPTETIHWLPKESALALGVEPGARFKAQARPRECARGRVKLAAIVKLAFDPLASHPNLRPLHGFEAFRALNGALFRFVIDEPGATLRDFEQLSRVAESVRVYELIRRRTLEDLEESCEVIRAVAKLHRQDNGT